MSVLQKLFFASILEIFFFEKIIQWKIFKTSFPTKKVILILVTRRPLPLETPCPPIHGFSKFFQKMLRGFKTATQHSPSLRLVMPHLVSHHTSPRQAATQHSPGLTDIFILGGGVLQPESVNFYIPFHLQIFLYTKLKQMSNLKSNRIALEK